MPRVLAVDPLQPDPAVIAEAAAVLARGGLVAFPTETVYGLGARGLHEGEVAKIFAAKGRPVGHPLILHVDGEPMARTLASSWPEGASRLARAFWPGPVTLVVPRAEVVPHAVTGGLDSVAVRAPKHAVALALISAVGEPLAAPSANAHMHVSPTTAAHVVRSLGDRVDMVLDAGPCAHGIESTVVDVREDPPRVLRAGAASLEALRAVEPRVAYDATALTLASANEAARASPGLAAKHYAPRARVVLVDARTDVARASAEAKASAPARSRVGAIVWSDEARAAMAAARESGAAPDLLVLLPGEAEAYARALFAAFYDADDAKIDVLLVERVPEAPEWWAVADRLRRAAA